MKSAIFEGRVRHRRFGPRPHDFTYTMFMVYLDLDELDEVFTRRWLWSARRPALARFRREDHLGDPGVPLSEAVRDEVEHRTGRRPDGPIRLLTNLRYFGYVMNPVSVYYCFDRAGDLETVVAEVHNTPWGELHVYVLDESRNEGSALRKRYRFRKDFHVSPFMPMDQSYDWRLTRPGANLLVHTENHDVGGKRFDATLSLTRKEISGATLAGALLRFPFMTGKVILAIYWQALRLWLKRTPFHPHPKHRTEPAAGAR